MSTPDTQVSTPGPLVVHADAAMRDAAWDAVWDLLRAADTEFVPPLSSREDTTQPGLGPASAAPEGPVDYFERMRTQELVLALASGQVVGFMSYLPQHTVTYRGAELGRYQYVTTLVVDPAWRGHGITRRFYDVVEAGAALASRPLATRTWSTNHAHLAILDARGFERFLVIPDDRGPGIDTVYLRNGRG